MASSTYLADASLVASEPAFDDAPSTAPSWLDALLQFPRLLLEAWSDAREMQLEAHRRYPFASE